MKHFTLTSLAVLTATLNVACASMYGETVNITWDRCQHYQKCYRDDWSRFSANTGGLGLEQVMEKKHPNYKNVTSNTVIKSHFDGTATVDSSD